LVGNKEMAGGYEFDDVAGYRDRDRGIETFKGNKGSKGYFTWKRRVKAGPLLAFRVKGAKAEAGTLLESIGLYVEEDSDGNRAHEYIREALKPREVASVRGQWVSPEAVRIPKLEFLLGWTRQAAAAPEPTADGLTETEKKRLRTEARTLHGVKEDLDEALEDVVNPAGVLQVIREKEWDKKDDWKELVKKLAAMVGEVVGEGGKQLPAGWVKEEDGRYSFRGETPQRPAELVLEAYWATMDYYFGDPEPEEIMEFKAVKVRSGESLTDLASRIFNSKERINSSKQIGDPISEQTAVNTYLSALKDDARFKELVQQQEGQLRALTRAERTVLNVASHLKRAMTQQLLQAQEEAQRRAAIESLYGPGSSSSDSGGGLAGKPSDRQGGAKQLEGKGEGFTDMLAGLNQRQVQKEFSKLPMAELEKVARVLGQFNLGQQQVVAAAGYQGGHTGTAFGVPRPGNQGRGGGFQQQGQGFGNGGMRGRGGGFNGGAGGGLRQWQHMQQQQQPPQGPAPGSGPQQQGRALNLDIFSCEGGNCRHGPPPAVCFVTNPHVGHLHKGWRPPPRQSSDYAVYLRNCARTGQQIWTPASNFDGGGGGGSGGGQGAGGQGATAAAAAVAGVPEEQDFPEGGGDAFPCNWWGFPACSLGANSQDDLAVCVPDQEGWWFGNRAGANGTAYMSLQEAGLAAAAAEAAAEGGCGAPGTSAAAAVGTGSSRLNFVDEKEQVDNRQARGQLVPISVPLLYQRDEDILAALVEREQAAGKGRGAAVAAAAVGLRSFTPANQRLQQQQANEWAKGRLLVTVEVWFPRDKDLLDQLAARTGVAAKLIAADGHEGREVEGSSSGQGIAVSSEAVGAAAVFGPTVSDYVAALPEADRHKYHQWAASEGGLITFSNNSFAEGVSLQTPDGRWFLPARGFYDSGCQAPLMHRGFGLAMGIREEPLPEPRYLIKADGKRIMVDKQFKGVKVCLKRGTAEEVSSVLNFLSMPEGGSLYNFVFCTLIDHQVGSMGVDRVERCFRYRPFYATKGDQRTVAKIPVKCWRTLQSGAAAASMAWREVSKEEWEAA